MSSKEYSIRVPKNNKKKFQVMRFNNSVNVDFGKWSQVKMERENNMKEFRGADEEQPKFGAGSEFGRDAREEARRKKFGIISRKYRPEDQPWLLKVGGKTGKKYKGIREGGVGANAAYYVFTHAADGAIEAFPLQEWYNFQPIQCYKALSAEEAEQEFGRRNKLMNHFSIMMRKRVRGELLDGDPDDAEDGKIKKESNKKKEFQISEMDDWVDSEDESSSNSDEEKDPEEVENKKKIKGKDKAKAKKNKNKKRRASDSEAGEESDDGDEEGREMDYISDSSASDSDKELKGVAEEDALRRLLSSGEEDEDEEKQDEKNKEKDSDGDETKTKDGDNADSKDNTSSKDGNKSANSKKKKKKTKKSIVDKKKKDEITTGGDSSSDWSSDSDGPSGTNLTSRSATPTHGITGTNTHDKSGTSGELTSNDKKRSIQAVLASANNESPPAKQSRFDPLPTDCGITEDAVRRYLARKPMSTIELLQKFKSKKTGLSSDRLVNTMTLILKRINPTRQTIKGKMYLSIPNDKRSNQLSSMPSSEGGPSGGDLQI